MKTIETPVHIEARPKEVWETLMHFEQYPQWNPFVKKIEGVPMEGSQLKIDLKPPGGQGMSFAPLVLRCKENEEFRWRGKLGIKGIFDGEHYLILRAMKDGSTSLTHGEQFSGILVPLFSGMITNTKKGFIAMNQALKRRCEALRLTADKTKAS